MPLGIVLCPQRLAIAAVSVGHASNIGNSRTISNTCPKYYLRLKLEASAFGFCVSMHLDECAEASAVNIVDVLQINDNPCDAGREEIVDDCTQPGALLSEHKTPFECVCQFPD